MQMAKNLQIIYLYILFLAFVIVGSYEREAVKILKEFLKKNKKTTPCECNCLSTGGVVNFQQVWGTLKYWIPTNQVVF